LRWAEKKQTRITTKGGWGVPGEEVRIVEKEKTHRGRNRRKEGTGVTKAGPKKGPQTPRQGNPWRKNDEHHKEGESLRQSTPKSASNKELRITRKQ